MWFMLIGSWIWSWVLFKVKCEKGLGTRVSGCDIWYPSISRSFFFLLESEYHVVRSFSILIPLTPGGREGMVGGVDDWVVYPNTKPTFHHLYSVSRNPDSFTFLSSASSSHISYLNPACRYVICYFVFFVYNILVWCDGGLVYWFGLVC